MGLYPQEKHSRYEFSEAVDRLEKSTIISLRKAKLGLLLSLISMLLSLTTLYKVWMRPGM